MTDGYGREINYLRISLTDRCNLRCRYCMPGEGICKKGHDDMLSLEEIYGVARAASELGFTKIRLTGGEPLVRRGVAELCKQLSKIDGIRDLAMTTNGTLLPGLAAELKAAGLMRLNISLDTLDPDKYRKMTRGGSLSDALRGIAAAEEAGFTGIKLNAVLIGGFNDDEIRSLAELTLNRPYQVRFIELMPIGRAVPFDEGAYLPADTVLKQLPELVPASADGVARLYRLPGAAGTVGLISPLSEHFCPACSRLRLTADGKLKPCLHSAEEISVKGLSGSELKERIALAIAHKPEKHCALSCSERSESARDMNRIGG